jgi:hypothetical protein
MHLEQISDRHHGFCLKLNGISHGGVSDVEVADFLHP